MSPFDVHLLLNSIPLFDRMYKSIRPLGVDFRPLGVDFELLKLLVFAG